MDNNSLMNKWKTHYRNKTTQMGTKVTKLSWLLFHFEVISQTYTMFVYITPHVFQEYGEMAQYYFKIFYSYLFLMCQANWFCTYLYSSDLNDIHDKPSLDENDWFQRPPDSCRPMNGEEVAPKVDRYGFEWKYCVDCDRYKPPRAHHCKVCSKCILRRDHHCYFVGQCVGHYNQRYFIVFCFLGFLVPTITLPMTISYLSTLNEVSDWSDYILPYTLYLYAYEGSISAKLALLVFQCYTLILFFFYGAFYFTIQMSLIVEGKTLVEVARQFNMQVTTGFLENARLVFGDYWLINFLFPAQIIFKQRHDGHHYNNIKMFGKKAT